MVIYAKNVHTDRYLPYPNPESTLPKSYPPKRRASPFSPGVITLFILGFLALSVILGILGCMLFIENLDMLTLLKDIYEKLGIKTVVDAVLNWFLNIFSTVRGWFPD